MKTTLFKNKKSSTVLISIGIIALLIFSLVFVWIGQRNSSQAEDAFVIGISLEGEYKIGDGEWQQINKNKHIPATEGDVTLRGTFQMHDPATGESLGTFFENLPVQLYLNHIGGYVLLPSGEHLYFDTEHELFGEDSCAVMWSAVTSTGEEPITIVLQNPHRFGNENAIDEFLEHMSAAEGIYLESMMLEQGAPQRNVGLVISISSLIILGIAVFSTIIHVKKCKEMWLMGMMSLSAGGYLLFDAFAVSVWNDSNIANTRMLGLFMMFYMFFGTLLITTLLKRKAKIISYAANIISALTIIFCISISFTAQIKFFDTWLWWAISECLVVITFALCIIFSFKSASVTEKKLYAVSLFFLISFPVDCLATANGWWEGGLVSKFVFFAIFIMVLVVVLLITPSHINAAIRAKELEAEQQLLKQELQENRISIMLSQMKPHFIFNTLNTIYHLCDLDPAKAKSTISSFSTYLRNNINNLEQSEMIFFEKELSFINAYLDIEKVRFDDELLIFYDIAVTNFKLPVLTVQPIVENAVKHGTSKKEGVSHLYISTSESDQYFEVRIRDTGVGFDINQLPDDGQKHVGISSVRQRLKVLCNGTLTIESVPGVGTTAIIRIPKKEGSSK